MGLDSDVRDWGGFSPKLGFSSRGRIILYSNSPLCRAFPVNVLLPLGLLVLGWLVCVFPTVAIIKFIRPSNDRLKESREGKRRHCMRGKWGLRWERGEKNRVETGGLRKQELQVPAQEEAFLRGQESQIDLPPWIATSGRWKWRRREAYRWGRQGCWRTMERRRCWRFNDRWRVQGGGKTDGEEHRLKMMQNAAVLPPRHDRETGVIVSL